MPTLATMPSGSMLSAASTGMSRALFRRAIHRKDGSVGGRYRSQMVNLPKSYGRRWHVEIYQPECISSNTCTKSPLDVKISAAVLLRLAGWCRQRATDGYSIAFSNEQGGSACQPTFPPCAQRSLPRKRRPSFRWISFGRSFRRRGDRSCSVN